MTQMASAAGRTIGGASARGASHIRRNKPNQDAHGGWVWGRWSMIAVSDGHGGDAYFRSERGSRLAIEAVREAFTALSADGTASAADLGRLQAGFLALPARIVATWRKAVESDIRRDPDSKLPAGNPHVAYGATCIAAAFGPGVSIFAQIGDGDLLAAPPGGDLVKPLPDDEGLEGEQTYSLCHADAVAHFRTKLFGAPHPLAAPGFAMASSDGLSKSFAKDEQFFGTARHWRALVEQNGMQAACADLEGWLAKCSEMGAGDDNTLMMFYDAAQAPIAPSALPAGDLAVPSAGTLWADDAGLALPAASKVYGLGALVIASALGVAIGTVGTYYLMRDRQPAALPPAPVDAPVVPLPSAPPAQPQVEKPAGEPKSPEPQANKPAQPVELGVPARPTGTGPRNGKHAPLPSTPAIPVPAPEK